MKAYKKSNIPLAKKLRKHMTPWERHLWYDFLHNYPVRFQRQKAIGDYIVDFYCAKARLVIELDGGGHYEPEQMQADQIGTDDLESMNLCVVRICNLDIDKNFSGVCEYIDMVVKESLPQSASLTAPSSEGALVQSKTVYALGFFDGVHLGHQALLHACRDLADSRGWQAGAVTFVSHPDTLVWGKTPKLLNTTQQRCSMLKAYGMDTVVELPFDEAFKTMDWRAFLELLKAKYGAAGFVCGDDFRFGHRGLGNAALLQAACREWGMPCVVVQSQTVNGVRISSTHIRSLIEKGSMVEAGIFLGRPHELTGTVVRGKQLGRTIGIPTANLLLPDEVVCPAFGVYACKAIVDGREYMAVTNVGVRPTVSGSGITVEPWLLDFEGDLYGKVLTLEFYDFLRPERKFDSLEELAAQIRENAEQTRRLLG